jgi:hypothetical protein
MVKPLILKISFIEINEKMSKFLKKEGGGDGDPINQFNPAT